MLDADTKRRIDTARDILVGKVPDPKSQVEQITTLIYYLPYPDLCELHGALMAAYKSNDGNGAA